MKLREQLIEASRAHFEGHVLKHKANVEVYLKNPAGIGEHSDIMEAIECELAQIAEYEDKLEVLDKHFGDYD